MVMARDNMKLDIERLRTGRLWSISQQICAGYIPLPPLTAVSQYPASYNREEKHHLEPDAV